MRDCVLPDGSAQKMVFAEGDVVRFDFIFKQLTPTAAPAACGTPAATAAASAGVPQAVVAPEAAHCSAADVAGAYLQGCRVANSNS